MSSREQPAGIEIVESASEFRSTVSKWDRKIENHKVLRVESSFDCCLKVKAKSVKGRC